MSPSLQILFLQKTLHPFLWVFACLRPVAGLFPYEPERLCDRMVAENVRPTICCWVPPETVRRSVEFEKRVLCLKKRDDDGDGLAGPEHLRQNQL